MATSFLLKETPVIWTMVGTGRHLNRWLTVHPASDSYAVQKTDIPWFL